jgi:hypothetical protein
MSGADDVRNIVTAINPGTYYKTESAEDFEKLERFKKIIKEEGIIEGLKTADKEKVLSSKALASYKLVYQSDSNQLEPVYFWLLDFMQSAGIKVEKIVDNFTSSAGSGHFSEMGQRATMMQQQATKILADTNTLIKTIINLIYDLKEFEIRIGHYKKAKSDDKKEKEEGMLALKNIWLDQVDLKRGRGSIHQMAAEMGFTTLREAFLVANSTEDVKKMAGEGGVINDSVMRVLLPRMSEFFMWKDLSEKEINSRFEIEKSYLRSEVESLKMYTKWAKPYLKAAEELRMKGFDKDPALVSAFSTTRFEITLLGKGKGTSPDTLKFKDYKLEREYKPVYVISLNYRGELAQKITQRGDYGYGYGGKVDVTFECYALNSEEIGLLDKTLKENDILEGLKLVENNTDVALSQLKDDIDKYCGESSQDKLKKEKAEKKKESSKSGEDINPFKALWDLVTLNFSSSKKDKMEIKEPKDIKKDNFVEKDVRINTENAANKFLYTIYDVYKKAHIMASSPESFDNYTEKKNDKPLSWSEFVKTRKA